MKIQLTDQPNSLASQFILQRLREFNHENVYPNEHRDLAISIEGENGEIIAGLVGYSNWHWLYIRLLWVSDHQRGQGLGKKLLALAEEESKKRSCRFAWIDTFNPQARKLYESVGYRVFGELEECPPGKTRYFLKKIFN